MTRSHVFRDLILDHVFRGCGSFDGFELGRLIPGLAFCIAVVVTGKTCLKHEFARKPWGGQTVIFCVSMTSPCSLDRSTTFL